MILTAVILVNGCSEAASEKEAKMIPKTTYDSIQKWIDLAGNRDLPISEREIFLTKSFLNSQKIKEDSVRVAYLSKISWASVNLKDSLTFRKVNAETIKLSRLIKLQAQEAEANWDLAFFFKQNHIQDSSYYYYGKTLDLYTALDDDYNSGRILLNMADVQKDVKDYTGSEVNTVKAIKMFKPLNKNSQLFSCYNNLAIVSRGLKEYDSAIEYYNKAMKYLSKVDSNKERYYLIKNNIGFVFQEQGKHMEALEMFSEVLENKDYLKSNPKLYAKALDNYAFNQFKSGSIDGVEKKLKKALAIMDSLNDISEVAASYYSLSEFYTFKKDKPNALSAAINAKSFAKQSTNNTVLLQSLKLLGQLDAKNAVKHTQEYISLNDSLQQEERKIRNKFARIQFETDETKEENRLLAQQKKLWVGIAATLLLLALLAFLFIDQRVKNQKLRFQREQQESNEKIFTLLLAQKQKVEEGKKIAQKRISEELHDGVQGRIQGVRMLLLGLNKRTTPEAIEERGEAIKELMDIQEEVRVISHELSHAAYQKIHNFIQSIEELLLGVKNSAALEYAFEYDDEVDWDGLNSDVKVNLYRMVQESIQNCVKHAKASTISLKFAVQNQNNLQVTLVDDGKGFVVKKGKKGIGLRNISSRIEKVGGTWDIESSPGKGTSVYFNIPIQTIGQTKTEYEEIALQEV